MEIEDQARQEPREASGEIQSKFLTILSHQLRTPLNMVRWGAETLLSGGYPGLTGEAQEILHGVYKSSINSIAIIDDILIAIGIEQRTLQMEKSESDIRDIVTKVVHDYAKHASLKGVALKLNDPPEDLPRLFLDPAMIGKILSCLVGNAIAYTPAGGQVELGFGLDSSEVHVTVRDTGVGIAERDQPRVFDRFFRSTKALKLNPDASGLGLYISKYIANAHGGDLSFDTKEGKGTLFTLVLPKKALVP